MHIQYVQQVANCYFNLNVCFYNFRGVCRDLHLIKIKCHRFSFNLPKGQVVVGARLTVYAD